MKNVETREHTYLYKHKVEIESLYMVDDVAHIQESRTKSVEDNARIVSKFEHDKLELNEEKMSQDSCWF